jgi:hypothetical protein
MTERETVPCMICGRPTPMTGTKLCDGCWEVTSRLETFFRGANAWEAVRKYLPVIDDWNDGHPDTWGYEAVLRDNGVTVEWSHQLVDGEGTVTEAPPGLCGWGFYWKHGAIHIGHTTEIIARKATALFVSLWLRRVSASFCDKLIDGFIVYLERQENQSLTFLADVDHGSHGPFAFRLTREGMVDREVLDAKITRRIVQALNPGPEDEIIVTFTKRAKYHPPVHTIRYEDELGGLIQEQSMTFRRLHAEGEYLVIRYRHFRVSAITVQDGVQHVRLRETL